MRYGLRSKYIFVGILLILGFLGFLLTTSAFLRETMVSRWNHQRMAAIADDVIRRIDDVDWDLSKIDLDTLAFENNVSLTVTDEDYAILTSTRARELSRGTLGPKSKQAIAENSEALKNSGKGFYSDFDDDNKASFILVSGIEGQGYLIVRKSVTGLNSMKYLTNISYILATGAALVSGVLVLVWLSGKMTRPVREISRVTGQIAMLNFDEKVPVRSRDELGELAESVNLMSDRLKEAMGSLQKDVENRKLLVRNMGHELKTPAAVIMGYAENLPYVAAARPEKLEEYCSVISTECERMDCLIRQMLEVSASELGGAALNRSFFSAGELLADVERSYQEEQLFHRGRLEARDETTEPLQGDYASIRRALYNLVKNAVRYGREDGVICVRLWQDSSFVHLSVHNQGSFIPEEEQSRIWDMFYKADTARTREEKSFGIGLSIVKETASAHGGGVHVENTEDGVCVEFYIPRGKSR